MDATAVNATHPVQEMNLSPKTATMLEVAVAEVLPPGGTAARRLATYEDCTHAIDDLFKRALKSEGRQGFMKFLDFACRLNHMAVFNAMMVQVQRPGCMLAATRGQWAKVGRSPIADAIPIVILRPFGPLGFVYDVDDTEGDPLPGEKNPFVVDGCVSPKLYSDVRAAAMRNRVMIEESDQYGSGLAGTVVALKHLDDGRQFPVCWRIRLNQRHPLPVKFATLAHELGHIYCGHLGAHPENLWPARTDLDHEHMELEAEAVCWIVSLRHSVKPNSPDYLSRLIRKVPLTEVSMWTIYAAANRVESGTKRASAAEPEIGP